MTTSSDPDKIRAEIEETRRDLSRNVDALSYEVQPSTMARRQGEKLTGALGGLKERVMGSAEDLKDRVLGNDEPDYRSYGSYGDSGDSSRPIGDLKDQASQRLSDAQGAVQGAPAAARRQTRGNPLGAGLVALGAGWLLGSLLPSSQREQEASLALKEKAQPLLQEAQDQLKASAETLRPHAEEAMETLKSAASDAAQNVKGEGQSVAGDLKGSADDAKGAVQDSRN